MEHQHPNGYVINDVSQGIAAIEFYHPASNSLPGNLLKKLASIIEEAGKNPEVKVILIRSAGNKAFCAGASFDELISIRNAAEGFEFFSGFSDVILAMRNAPKFVICRVQGKAVGGGVGVASAADFTFATTHAAVKLSELAVGIGPFVVGPAVERKIGTSGYSTLAINASNWYTAEWAERQGLYASLHDSIENMDIAIKTLLEQLVQSNPEAMAEIKKAAWINTEHWQELLPERARISGALVLSDFTRQAIERFKSK